MSFAINSSGINLLIKFLFLNNFNIFFYLDSTSFLFNSYWNILNVHKNKLTLGHLIAFDNSNNSLAFQQSY
jgi:hypothetical protein